MKAFLTGSRVYGYPDKDSDIDLVIHCDKDVRDELIRHSDTGKMPCIYGKLNLIFTTTKDSYNAWLKAQEECVKRGPVTRSEAHAIHEKWRGNYGIKWDHDSGEGK